MSDIRVVQETDDYIDVAVDGVPRFTNLAGECVFEPEDGPIRIDIGAGSKRTEGWLSLGFEDGHDIKSDVRNLLVAAGMAHELRAIHVVEHIPLRDVPAMFADWFRAMAPGAMLAIEGPDLAKCCRNFLADPTNARDSTNGIYGDHSTDDQLLTHKWGMTYATLRRLLMDAGFIKVREENPRFHGQRVQRDLRVVAMKPEHA